MRGGAQPPHRVRRRPRAGHSEARAQPCDRRRGGAGRGGAGRAPTRQADLHRQLLKGRIVGDRHFLFVDCTHGRARHAQAVGLAGAAEGAQRMCRRAGLPMPAWGLGVRAARGSRAPRVRPACIQRSQRADATRTCQCLQNQDHACAWRACGLTGGEDAGAEGDVDRCLTAGAGERAARGAGAPGPRAAWQQGGGRRHSGLYRRCVEAQTAA